MSYYSLNGAPELTSVSLKAYEQKQTPHWRFVVALSLLLMSASISLVTAKTFGSVEQASSELSVRNSEPQYKQHIPSVAAAVDRSPELQRELDAWVSAQKDSEWAFSVHSLENDELKVAVHEKSQIEMASIYKLFLLKPLAQKIPAEAWAATSITERTYLACVQAMLSLSDNPCAEAIAARLGWTGVHRQLQADGYRQTVVNRTDMFVSTAADTALLLDRLYHGDGYNAKTREIALNALGTVKRTEAIRKACTDCKVYNKTGDLNGYKHDAAIVEKNDKVYVVVIFSKGASWGQLVESATVISQHL